MSNTNDFILESTIICDDIRMEANGKLLLIGVYPEGILINTTPLQIMLSIWIQFKMKLTKKTTFEFGVKGNILREPPKIIMEIGDDNLLNKMQDIPVIFKLPLEILNEGVFDIYYKNNDDNDIKIARTVRIEKNKMHGALN